MTAALRKKRYAEVALQSSAKTFVDKMLAAAAVAQPHKRELYSRANQNSHDSEALWCANGTH
jgi:hypothetical protein